MTGSPATEAELAHARDLLAYLDAGPSPFHAVAETLARLTAAGFEELDPAARWDTGAGRFVVRTDGAIVAWAVPEAATPSSPFRIVGAHSDSPGFRVKPRPDLVSAGVRQVACEVYGGPLLNSWLDRDLGLAGRVAVRTPAGPALRLLRDDRPVLRIPQLAIHLDRQVNEQGLQLDRQRHLTPMWGLAASDLPTFAGYVASMLDVAPSEVLSFDLAPFDLQAAALCGLGDALVSSARLDNLCSCHAGLTALVDVGPDATSIAVLAMFDHEEVGSTTARGADGTLLPQVLERSVLARGGARDDFLRALAGSTCVSADMAHATHPNYPERHDPGHTVLLDGGPVLKVNASQRYATDAASAAILQQAAEAAGVELQVFVSRNDMPCGSTIGPLTAAGLAIPTVDVGVAQLAMHSVRELCGCADPHRLTRVLDAFFAA